VLPADSVWYIIMAFMWPLISSSNNWFLGEFSYQECNFFIFRYIFMIFSIKVCYQHRVSDVSSWTPCDLWSKCQIIDFLAHFCIRNVTFHLLIYIYYLWYEGGLSSGSVTHIIMSFMGHWPLTSTSNNGHKFRSQLQHLIRCQWIELLPHN
jgi:hypothetical protein